jgi:enoyl-CoA hydratase/carnithine racemase
MFGQSLLSSALNCIIRPLKRCRSLSLISKHVEFLALIKDHGHGDIRFDMNANNVATLIIDNPRERNSISGRMMYQFGLAIEQLLEQSQQSKIKGLIVTGSADYFCSGASLSLANERLNSPEKGKLMAMYMTEVLDQLRASQVVSVALINGPAIGGGAELITSTDFRLISSASYIRYLHASIGAAPGWGGVRRLISLIGRRQTLRLLGTCSQIPPEEALKIGLVDEIINLGAKESLNAHGETFLDRFYGSNVHASVSVIKELVSKYDTAYDPRILQVAELDMFTSRWFSLENKLAIDRFINAKSKKP